MQVSSWKESKRTSWEVKRKTVSSGQIWDPFVFISKIGYNSLGCRCLVAKLCLALLQHHGLYPASLLCLWYFPGKNSRVGCHFLLQGIFLTQGSYIAGRVFTDWATRETLACGKDSSYILVGVIPRWCLLLALTRLLLLWETGKSRLSPLLTCQKVCRARNVGFSGTMSDRTRPRIPANPQVNE